MFFDIKKYLKTAIYLFFIFVKAGFSVENITGREIRGMYTFVVYWKSHVRQAKFCLWLGRWYFSGRGGSPDSAQNE